MSFFFSDSQPSTATQHTGKFAQRAIPARPLTASSHPKLPMLVSVRIRKEQFPRNR
jgi:hypothetical protein